MQTQQGTFVSIDTALFAKNKFAEEVDAVFFDANNDGFEDLYVTNGGNEMNDGSIPLKDKLYMNDGRGHFTDATLNLPVIPKNKSCVIAADIDHDGTLDRDEIKTVCKEEFDVMDKDHDGTVSKEELNACKGKKGKSGHKKTAKPA